MEQLFIVLDADPVADTASAQQAVEAAGVRVVHRYGPRAFIVEGDARVAAALAARAGVAGVFDGTVPAAVSERLDQTGQLAVAAWNARHEPGYRAAKTRRTGDGLSWDHPDFAPEGRNPGPGHSES